MRLVHEAAFSAQELQVYRDIIANNVFDGLRELATVLRKSSTPECDDAENNKRLRYFSELTDYPPLTSDEVRRCLAFWQDKNVQKTFANSQSELFGVLEYFMGRLDEIGKDDYVPSHDDILRSRQRSTGASETSFVVFLRSIIMY
jgi:hypothetical protein